MKYKVEITETLRKVVEIEAESAKDAINVTSEHYHNAEEDFILYPEYLESTDFNVINVNSE